MEQMIQNLGFPIACVIAIGYYFIKKDTESRQDTKEIIENMRKDNKEERDLYRETINKFDDKLDKFAVALENNTHELSNIKDDVNTIKEKVGV